MDSKVSVIIPTYNRSHLLAETLASVYGQTWDDYEIIVVDDGSEDDTPALFAAPQARLTYHRIDHAGASAARNAGMALSHGESVAFLDSDDLWAPQFLEQMTAALAGAPHCGFAYCDYATFDAHGTVCPAYLPAEQKRGGHIFGQLVETDFIATGALLIRRECLARVGGFDPALAVAHDWDLWLRLANRFEAVCVDAPLARIRVDSNGLTRSTPLLLADNVRILSRVRRDLAEPYAPVIRRQLVGAHRALARYHWRARRPLPGLWHTALMLAILCKRG